MAKTTSLFKYVLGNRFQELPAALRAMLEGRETRRYRGTASVTRGSNTLSHLLGGLMGLPRKAQDISVNLEIVPGVHRETWTRHFGRKTLRTAMRAGGRAGRGRIVERVGAVSLTLELAVEGGDLVYRTLSARLMGLPLPRFLAPSVEARAAEDGGKLVIESTTRAGSIGRILRYRLILGPEPVSEADIAAAEAMARAHAAEPERTVAPASAAAPAPAKPATPGPGAAPETDPSEATLIARPASASSAKPMPTEPMPTEQPPASQRAPHPAEAGVPTVPIDTARARPGRKRSAAPPPETDAPRPAAPNEATVPASPSRRRKPPQTEK